MDSAHLIRAGCCTVLFFFGLYFTLPPLHPEVGHLSVACQCRLHVAFFTSSAGLDEKHLWFVL